MSLLNVFPIAGSGLNAQSVRLNTTASNLANAESVSSSVEQTYRARHPVFATALEQAGGTPSAGAGVEVRGIVESQAPLPMEYRPEHPLANAEGYVFMPNVNPVGEMADMISASRSYQTNLEVFNTTKQLLLRTLELGRG
jgi:flagellar basal-body rod protein FlgC